MKKIVSFLFIVSIMAISCEKEVDNQDLTQAVVFEYEYMNHAWGFAHFGWMIDSEGQIKGFELPDNWNHPNKDGMISKSDLGDNLDQTDTVYGSVKNSDLLKHFGNRQDFTRGRKDTSDVYMADAGVGALYAYVWDSSEKMYEKVLLATRGDFTVTNTNREAKSAVKWLKEIGKQTDRFTWIEL